ncbi:hypothetical protein ACFLU4_09010 [Chloroflexota bacterium]
MERYILSSPAKIGQERKLIMNRTIKKSNFISQKGSIEPSIYFVGPYEPIMCGIADYTGFLAHKSPVGRWGTLSFNTDRYGGPLTADREILTSNIWYGIPDRTTYNASVIQSGLSALGVNEENSILW